MFKLKSKMALVAFGLVLILLPSGASAQPGFNLNVDAACFPEEGDTLETLLEVYYTIPRSQLRFIPTGGIYEAAMDISMRLENVNGDSVDQVSWRGTTTIADPKELDRKDYKFFDTVPAFIRPGEYFLIVSIKDVNSGMNGKIRKRISVPDYTQSGLKLSQIQFAYSLNPDTLDSPSVKDGVLVIPNASGLVIPEDNFIYFYAELHGLKYDPNNAGLFRVDVDALDASGNTILKFYSNTIAKPGKSAVISNGVNGNALPDGNYQLRILATDLETGDSVHSLKPLKIRHSIQYAANPLMKSLFKAHPEAEQIRNEDDAKLVRNEIEYIASVEDLKTFEKLSIDGDNNFMKDFWKKRDPNPSNDLNEFQVQHYARWDYANASFTSRTYQKGWATDKGRVFILYGPPAEREDSGVAMDTKPYEVWKYYNIPDQPGERIFVFVDDQGHGDYRLYHSNVKGERSIRNWEESLQANKVLR